MQEEYDEMSGCGKFAFWIGVIGLFGIIVTIMAGG